MAPRPNKHGVDAPNSDAVKRKSSETSKLRVDEIQIDHRQQFHHQLRDELGLEGHCKRTVAAVAAAAAAVVAVVAVGKWKTTCKVLLSLLSVFPCSRFSLSPPATRSVSRASRAALVAARHTFRRPRAVRRCGPLSVRTHQASLHHVMCLFDTFISSCIEFVSFFASTPFSCVAISSSPSCPSWASTSLSPLRSS